ncbi:MAG: SCP2 sterol-binding domain-containing protein [Deltaproteobacteria bacterium]|nr:SCP2 sterol-binding domain-containing protein [Deltaproteobacteria bacterium]
MRTPGEFFAAFEEAARDDPDAATQPDAVFKFVITGDHGGTWTLNLKRGASSPFVTTGDGPKEDASIHVASDDWVALTTGEMNPMRAFMSGKVRVDGDLKLAVNLPNVVNMVEGYGIGTQGPISAAIARFRGALAAIRRKHPSIDPTPPIVSGSLPWVGAGRALVRDPTEFFNECRKRHGDTFLVDAFGYRLLCLFSPAGVRNLWRLPEETASKALADLTLLSHKVPIELFEGRRTLPHDLFSRDDVEVYLDHLYKAVELELSALGESGSLELFAFTKRLAHRMGLASWGGMSAASDEQLDALAAHFEQLDASESFVHPHKALLAVATRKRRERRAMHAIESIFADMLQQRRSSTDVNDNDLFTRICASWDDVPSPAREVGIARDVIVVHMGSQSNLFAAMAWTLIFALRHPSIVDRILSEGDAVLDSFSHESIRMSQRSIVLRRVVSPVGVADEKATYRVQPGTLIATMLSVTNQSAAKGLDQFDEKNYRGASFVRTHDLPARELVTTYGHGKHMCPAHRFSTSAIRHSVGEIFRRYELRAEFDEPLPLPRQIGGVARADRPCIVRYMARR